MSLEEVAAQGRDDEWMKSFEKYSKRAAGALSDIRTLGCSEIKVCDGYCFPQRRFMKEGSSGSGGGRERSWQGGEDVEEWNLGDSSAF